MKRTARARGGLAGGVSVDAPPEIYVCNSIMIIAIIIIIIINIIIIVIIIISSSSSSSSGSSYRLPYYKAPEGPPQRGGAGHPHARLEAGQEVPAGAPPAKRGDAHRDMKRQENASTVPHAPSSTHAVRAAVRA